MKKERQIQNKRKKEQIRERKKGNKRRIQIYNKQKYNKTETERNQENKRD